MGTGDIALPPLDEAERIDLEHERDQLLQEVAALERRLGTGVRDYRGDETAGQPLTHDERAIVYDPAYPCAVRLHFALGWLADLRGRVAAWDRLVAAAHAGMTLEELGRLVLREAHG